MIGTANGNRDLCQLDPSTGAILSTVSLNALTDDVVDMDFDPAVSDTLYCLLKSTNVIVRIDTATGVVLSQTVLSSDLTIANSINGAMGFNRLGNQLYISKGSAAEGDRIHVYSREHEQAYCFGDGSLFPCPCGNNGTSGGGCANSVFAAGAHLGASGNTIVSHDNTTLRCSGVPPNASALFYQGTTPTAGGNGSPFGDGLRCVSGSVIRLGIVVSPASGTAQYPGPGNPSVSVRGLIPAAGAVRFYQTWYRNAASFCTASTFNLSNGVRLLWAP